ncbi:reverse transcriptase domain-containing protein [Tanacetum coccineum]
MAETMEQYMSKTRADYGSGVVRPIIEDKDNFELKGQFLKELRTNTFSGSDHEDTNEHILEIMDLFHIPNITIDQVMLRASPCPLPELQEVVLFYNGLDVLTRQILNSRGAIPSKTAADAKTAIQEIDEYSQKWHNGTSRCKGPYYTKDCPLKEDGKTLEEAYYTQFGGPFQGGGYRATTPGFYQRNNANLSYQERSVSVMPLLTYLNLGLDELAHTRLTVELADRIVKYPKGISENVLAGIGKFTFPVDFIILDMPEDIKVPLILGRPFLSTARSNIDVYKRKITLRVGEENIIFKSFKPASSLIMRVYMLEPFKLRRNQGDDLMPTIEEGEVIEEFRTRDDELDFRIDDYPSYCDYDKKIHIDCAHNLKFSCMIGFEFTHANFFPLLYVNVMSKKFHNSIMKDKMVYKGNNVIGALMNVPIFVGTFSVVTDFAVLEDTDAYRDEGMGDVIFGEPFLSEVGIKARRFEGMITIYNGNESVTYQMVSDDDKKNGISHPYQKLKGFYKGVLNLGPNYI